jgi:hypothetical protein
LLPTERISPPTPSDDREKVLSTAQAAFADFSGKLQRELTESQLTMANQLLRALERANSRTARSLALVPRITVEPLENGTVLDPSITNSSFSVRVRADGEAVRIVGAVARRMDGSSYTLRDDLNGLPIIVSETNSAIISFDVREHIGSEPANMIIEVSFEHGGGAYDSAPFKIVVKSALCPELPTRQPYISGRALLPSEVDSHFFGREAEERILLDSVSEGQQSWRYVEGIRKVGKSSLLSSLIKHIKDSELPIIPVYISAANASASDAGRLLYNLLDEIARDPQLEGRGVQRPEESRIIENPSAGYREFVSHLGELVPEQRVLALLDDFQALVEAAHSAQDHNPALRDGITRIFDVIRHHGTPSARLTWLFTGHRAHRDYKRLLPGVLLWGEMRPVSIDFLSINAVSQILTVPLKGSGMSVPGETVRRVHQQTGGHPDVVQQIGELMFQSAKAERRPIMTPADADQAASDIALYTDVFADTWYPMAQLSREQREFIGAFTNAVPLGNRISPHRLVPREEMTDAWRRDVDDLVSRKILTVDSDGAVGIRSHVLELWLREKVPASITDSVNGSVAIFVDVANLTGGSGRSYISNLSTRSGEDGIPGSFRLDTVIDRIEIFSQKLSPAPIADKWIVNYPLKSAAVLECSAKNYRVENIPEDLWEKGQRERGADDVVLIEKVTDVERHYPTVNHFVLVTGDKGYRFKVDKLLREGKYVSLISRESALAGSYDRLSAAHPERFSVVRLESLLEDV